ncbi:hypothetical protein HON01_07210, partial [Candidatus Woesearchaeota archaeon]|nr:hypothetical protein [Candidatus Woesearchaeota archaeon]
MSHTLQETQGQISVIKYDGVFDYDGLVDFLFGWFKSRSWFIQEKTFKHKKSGLGHEIEREFTNWRKISEYYKYNVGVKMHLWDAYPIDAVKDGKKQKLMRARIEIILDFSVECDYQGKYESSQFLEKLRNFMHEYVMKKDIIVQHGDSLYYT